ncbi:hypothetical protein EDC04DRAFT_461090 [Pisolithus marmoratus]|nr:hypothetical protein EDC04DRAFT_461090 [Pisolithus marmoratus]
MWSHTSSHRWLTLDGRYTLSRWRLTGVLYKCIPRSFPPPARFSCPFTMSPTPLPALPSTSVSAARLNVFHNVKRAQEGTDVTTIVLVAVCVVFLLVILFSVARYFNRESSPFSPSSSGPSGRFTLRQFFPPQLRSRCTSNRASCTPTVGHSDPFPPLPKDLTRPWSEYHPAYPRVHHPLPPCPYRSCRASEYRPGGLDEYQPGGRIPLGRRAFSVYLADGLPTHRKPRPSNTMRPPVRKSVSVQEVGPPPERSSSNDVNEVVVQPVQILQPPEPQSALSTLAVAREPSIATSEEAQIGHTVGDECDTDTASESASGTATPKAGTDERRLGECEVSM